MKYQILRNCKDNFRPNAFYNSRLLLILASIVVPEEIFYAKGAVIQSHYAISNEAPDSWSYCIKVIVPERGNNFDEVLVYRDRQLRREISRGINNAREPVNVVQTRFERVGYDSFAIDFCHSNKTPELVFVSPICKPEKSDLSYSSIADIAYTFDCNCDIHSHCAKFIQSTTLLGINLIKKGSLEGIESTREKIIEEFSSYNRDRGDGVNEVSLQNNNSQSLFEDLSQLN